MKKILTILFLSAFIFCNGTEAYNDSFDTFLNTFFETFKESDIHHEFKYVSLYDQTGTKDHPFSMVEKKSFDSMRKAIVDHYRDALKRKAVKTITRTSSTTYDVKFSGPDSGYLIIFHFKRISRQWKLIKFAYKST